MRHNKTIFRIVLTAIFIFSVAALHGQVTDRKWSAVAAGAFGVGSGGTFRGEGEEQHNTNGVTLGGRFGVINQKKQAILFEIEYHPFQIEHADIAEKWRSVYFLVSGQSYRGNPDRGLAYYVRMSGGLQWRWMSGAERRYNKGMGLAFGFSMGVETKIAKDHAFFAELNLRFASGRSYYSSNRLFAWLPSFAGAFEGFGGLQVGLVKYF